MSCIDSVIFSLFNNWDPIPDVHDAFLESLPTCSLDQTKAAPSEHFITRSCSLAISRTSSWNISRTPSFTGLDGDCSASVSQGEFAELGMSDMGEGGWAAEHVLASISGAMECAHSKLEIESGSDSPAESCSSRDTPARSSPEPCSPKGGKPRSARRCGQKKNLWTAEEHELFLLGLQKFGNRPISSADSNQPMVGLGAGVA
eukprot:CAMPEP_0181331192 /NCGR_PEP_ID=MMETSP1101-20121128/24360_1 /TAXON_ID=46948 /ORGANISM="Rhodomonas abbreviata, Strain Caron Lab Isolate" /LENGTH=201 /DNA_ID=CAMNT_0023440615 /DNA_START=100 /DNA_END=701 /DNA_ORIENTATION=+